MSTYRRPNKNNNGGGSGFKLPKIPLKGLFGGNKGPAPPRPSYGAPRPGYGAPNRPARPQGPPRPNYGGGGQASGGSFGPSNAIKMLPAPNLATARPPVGILLL